MMRKLGSPILPLKGWRNASNNHIKDDQSAFNMPQRAAKNLSWKPANLKFYILIPTIIITSALIALLGVLLWKTKQHGGILFAENLDDMPTAYTFAYLYLPTIFAVLYSILWSWIDLDAKRLEPFFQLSKSSGSAAADSVLLHYPVDFLAAVPVRAARRKQWAVVSAGTVMMIVFWVITPLQSSIFASSSISRSTAVTMTSSHLLLPVSEQHKQLTARYLNTAYGMVWLGQRPPSFTTRDITLAPFAPQGISTGPKQNITWSSPTVQYGTDLTCHTPEMTKEPNSKGFIFDNGKGCRARDIYLSSQPKSLQQNFAANYIGWPYDGYVHYFLRGSECRQNSSHNFLAIWQRLAPKDIELTASNFTALFCEMSYYYQEVQANVTYPSFSVLSISPLGPKKTLPDSIFNSTHFEHMLSTGVSSAIDEQTTPQPNPNRLDLPDQELRDQSVRMGNFSLEIPVTNMVAFAVGASRLEPAEYLDPQNMASAFQAAHRLLFALAVQSFMMPANGTVNSVPVPGLRASQVDAVFLISSFTIIVQAALFIVVMLTVYLLIIYWRRQSCLSTDPSSITAIMSLAHNQKLMHLLRDLDEADSRTLEKRLKQLQFQLRFSTKTHDHVLDLDAPHSNVSNTPQQDMVSESRVTPSSPQSVCPIELSLPVGLLFMSLLTAFMVVLCVLKSKINQCNGLPLPSGSLTVQQLLLNYLPTAVSTLIEPFWVVLNRLRCLLQPFDELRLGSAPPSASLNLRYSSLPPQLVFWRAIRARHFLLAAVCAIALLANVLTVALSGLFNKNFVYLSENLPLRQLRLSSLQTKSAWINAGTTIDHFYIANSNITAGTSLPPWVTPSHYLVPFELPPSIDIAARYKAVTTAVSAELECREMNTTQSKSFVSFALNEAATFASLSTTHHQPDGVVFRCYPDLILNLEGSPAGTNALEVLTMMVAHDTNGTSAEKAFCPTIMVAGWIRSNITLGAALHSNSTKVPTFRTSSVSMEQMFMACRPRLNSTSIKITVDGSGTILDTESAIESPTSANITGLFSLSQTLDKGFAAPESRRYWHNDTIASNWPNYFIKRLTNSTAILDAQASVPLFAPTAAVLSDVYTRTFATLLSLNTVWSLPAADSANTTVILAQRITGHWRVFMNPTMFKLAIVILSLDLIVAIWLYAARPKAFLPRMPTSLASVIAFFAAGKILEDLKSQTDSGKRGLAVSVDEHMSHLESKGWKFGYGRLFPDQDGKRHVGIERVPFFTPLQRDKGDGEGGVRAKLRRRVRGIWRPGSRNEK